MASNPPGVCCTVGVKHEGTATGEIHEIGGIEVYQAYPKNKSTANAILLVTDVIGHRFINAQLIADQFAQNGYFVYMPDLFHGDAVPAENKPPGFELSEWLKGHPASSVDPIIEASIKEMREKLSCLRIGAVGYCFGAKYVARYLKTGKLDAGYVAHPSFVTPEELEGIEGPLSISAAESDYIYSTEKRHQTEEILLKKDVHWQQNVFSDVEHGFAVRSDISKKRAKFAKEQAFLQAVHWFDLHVKA